jgi:hypothetical protein
MTTQKKSRVKYAPGILIRPTFEGKRKLKLAAKVNKMKQGEVLRGLIDRGISETGKIHY